MPAVSVIVPFRTAGASLHECLAHLARQTYRSFDVYLVADETLAFDDPRVHVIASGPVLPNRKRQLGAQASDAEIVAFIDDDAYPDPGWLAAAVRHFADPNVVAAGGPAVTPPADSALQRASGAIFASAIVSAGTRSRYVPAPQHDVAVLPSCNMLMRRAEFLRHVEASTPYWPGEDTLVCRLATRNGERIVYDPAALVFHHRRPVFAGHLRQVWSYGRFRGFFARRFDRSPRNAIYALPAAFALAHFGLFTALRVPRRRRAALAAAGCYAGLVAISAVREARLARTNPMLVAAGIYLTHLVFGCASIAGWLFGVPARDD